MNKFICTLLLSVPFIGWCQSNIESALPKHASYLMSVNGASLLNKMPLEDFEKLPIYAELEKNILRSSRIEAAHFSLNDMGLDLNSTSYVFHESSDSISFTGYISRVKAVNTFGGFAENFLVSKYSDNYEKLQGNGYSMIIDRGMVYAWNEQMAVMMEADISYTYFYTNPDVYDQYGMDSQNGDEWELQKALERQWLEAKVSHMFTDAAKQGARPEFADKGDIVVWTSSAASLPQYERFIGNYNDSPEYDGFVKELETYYKGNEATFALNFNEGQIVIESESKLNEKTFEFTKRLMGKKVDKAFAQYVKGDNLIGYYGVSIQLDELMDATKDFYYPLAEKFPEYGQMTIDVMELVDLILDDDAIFEVITGDMLFACTDVREFETTYYTYDYDENFERIKIPHTSKEHLPEMVLLMKTGNDEAVERLYRILEKTAGLVKKNNYYVIEGQREMPFPVYLGVHDGVICISNDESLVANMETGVKYPMAKEHIKALKKNSQVMYFDAKKLMERLPADEFIRSEKDRRSYDFCKESVSEIFWTQGKRKKSGYTSKMVMDTKEGVSSLRYAIDVFNEIYMIQKGMK